MASAAPASIFRRRHPLGVPLAHFSPTPEVLALIAARFRTLGDPARLHILDTLRGGETTVTGVVASTGLAQATVSKHLQLLHANGFVERRRSGLFVRYRLSDRSVFRICDMVCGRLEHEATARRRILRAK